MTIHRRLRLLALLTAVMSLGGATGRSGASRMPCDSAYAVTRDEMKAAMALHGAYNLAATTTSMRFGAEALLELVRRRRQEVPGETRLFIDQPDWFAAHMETAGVTYEQMSEAARAGFEHHQNALVEYGPDVLEKVEEGPTPRDVLDVTISWPDSDGAASSFTYRDTLSVPKVEVHDSRVIRFKLVRYDDMLLFDQIDGISVKPLGFLSAIFALVGKPDLKQSRVAVSADQWEVMRGRVKVLPGISKTGTAVIEPSGKGHEKIPIERSDLDSLERRLEAPVKLKYAKASCGKGG